jgi:hypothetical protein
MTRERSPPHGFRLTLEDVESFWGPSLSAADTTPTEGQGEV